MKRETFLEQVAEYLYEQENGVAMETQLGDLDGWDSLGRLSIAAFFSESFGVQVDNGTLMNCQTVGDLAALVEGHLE